MSTETKARLCIRCGKNPTTAVGDMTMCKDCEAKSDAEYLRWEEERSVRIPGCWATGGTERFITVWDYRKWADDNTHGQFRVDICSGGRQQAFMYLTPAEARRLSDLLLNSAAEVERTTADAPVS